MELNILVGGAAGQGMDTIGHLLSRALVREGYNILTSKDYMSRIRGGHNFTSVRIAARGPWAPGEAVDLLIALNEETYHIHRESVVQRGRIIYDPDMFELHEDEKRGVPVRLHYLARRAGAAVMSNTVAVGALLVLLGLGTGTAGRLLDEMFAGREGLPEKNRVALTAGYEEASAYCSACFTLPPPADEGPRLFIEGNQALGMAALASGCRFFSAYPMTPSTGIMNYLAGKQLSYEMVVEQAEDEIAAVNMVLGASFAGVRSMTATSGGGFSLMVEGISLSGMTETPIVVVVAMRPGPATGLPTRTEQGDLGFVVHSGHGEFPRAVLSATTLEDAFYRLNKAFELADRYQVPVLFLTDQYFADTGRSIAPYDFTRLRFNRFLVQEDELVSPYKRYRLTESGISPRAFPGQFAGEVVLSDSDEHDENGNIIEDGATRKMMVEKRAKKMEGLALEMDEPVLYGSPGPDILLLGWGSTYGALREAVDMLSAEGERAALLHFSDIWPLPVEELGKLLPQVPKSFCVENNATAQFAALLRGQTGLQVGHSILKYDGRPFTAGEIYREVKEHV